MIRTVTALFDDTGDAERGLDRLSSAVPVMKAGIVTCGPGEKPDFGSIYLSRNQREACEAELAEGGSLLIIQVEGNEAAEQAVAMLDRIAQDAPDRQPSAHPAIPQAPRPAPAVEPALFGKSRPAPAGAVEGVPITTSSRRAAPQPIAEPVAPGPQAAMPAAAPPQSPAPPSSFTVSEPAAPAPAPVAEPAPQAEERIPVMEEALRVGTRSVVRGGARVHSFMEEVPVTEEVELIEESTSVERRPVGRLISEEEIAASGLLQNRVVEITTMREEPVLTKESVVREELVVKKTIERRVEQIHETVRRTAVEVERLEPELADQTRNR
jgi:stress response protein YsnF